MQDDLDRVDRGLPPRHARAPRSLAWRMWATHLARRPVAVAVVLTALALLAGFALGQRTKPELELQRDGIILDLDEPAALFVLQVLGRHDAPDRQRVLPIRRGDDDTPTGQDLVAGRHQISWDRYDLDDDAIGVLVFRIRDTKLRLLFDAWYQQVWRLYEDTDRLEAPRRTAVLAELGRQIDGAGRGPAATVSLSEAARRMVLDPDATELAEDRVLRRLPAYQRSFRFDQDRE